MNYIASGISSLMNLTTEGSSPSSDVLFLNFNQDISSIAVGTKNGCRLYALSSVDRDIKVEKIYESTDLKEVCIFERLFSSALVAIVSLASPRKLLVYHYRKGHEICSYSFTSTILSVKLNRDRVIVCLRESLYIHNIKDMTVVHTISDTPTNPNGLCALSIDSENCFLAYPGSSTVGEVQIFDAKNLQGKLIIPAHDNPLAAMQFDSYGKKIATASGTVIRVFDVIDGSKLMEFRRGMTRCADIYSLSFSNDSKLLCASSNTETVHVFKLETPAEVPRAVEENPGWMEYFGRALMSSASYLPAQVSEIMHQERALSTVHLPFSKLKNVCALTTMANIPRVLVASADGFLYIYNVNMEEGTECTLVKQIRLINEPSAEGQDESNVAQGNSGNSTADAERPSGMGTASSYAATVRKGEKQGGCTSYAAIVRAGMAKIPSWSEASSPYDELVAASGGLIVAPPAGLDTPLRIDDESEFPPVTQRFDSCE
ncbi:WD repeat domain phosphoinositide-interacting protein 2 [Nymphon striatum]|nr:WD repeat domain phosphoinositide-interacting protein 2 [Nymphon striatum]